MTTTFKIESEGTFVKITGARKSTAFFPRKSTATIDVQNDTITIVRNTIHSDSTIIVKISELNGVDSIPSFQTSTLTLLKQGIAQYFTVRELQVGSSTNTVGDGTVDDIPLSDIIQLRDFMILELGADNVNNSYNQLVQNDIIEGIQGL
jgi:hypothetical protein